MPIRRLTRTPALPAGSLSALLAPYGGAMRTGAHIPVGNAPNCRSIVSTANRRNTNAQLRPNGTFTVAQFHQRKALSRAVQPR